MKNKFTIVFSALILTLAIGTAWAMPNATLVTINSSENTIFVPDHALEIAKNVFSLGTAIDPQTKKMEKD